MRYIYINIFLTCLSLLKITFSTLILIKYSYMIYSNIKIFHYIYYDFCWILAFCFLFTSKWKQLILILLTILPNNLIIFWYDYFNYQYYILLVYSNTVYLYTIYWELFVLCNKSRTITFNFKCIITCLYCYSSVSVLCFNYD